MDFSFQDMVIRLAVSALLAGLIGLEREAHEHPAGLRTHMLVSIGSTLFTLCSFSVSQSIGGHVFDPARITAQIVTGVGFLGAGTIIHRGSVVRGLTTAASIWAVAAIGMAVGIGGQMMLLAIFGSILVFATLSGASRLEHFLLAKREERALTISIHNVPGALQKIIDIISMHDAQPQIFSSEETTVGITSLRIRLRTGRNFDDLGLNNDLTESKDVVGYVWE